MENEEMKTTNTEDVTPESLMGIFKGPGFVKMVIVTIIIHVVVMGGSSIGYLKKSVFGEDTSKLTRDERIQRAVSDATVAIRKVAKEHGLNPQDISDQFATNGKRPVSKPAPQPDEKVDDAAGTPTDKPRSDIEKALEVKEKGPEKPAVIDDDPEEEDDLFK